MPPEERRAALVEATLPLLLEHGATVSTRQIAEAAGVAEGTIFRVFESKDDLVHACLHDALTNDALAEQLDALPRDLDLPDTVARTAAILAERIAEIRTLLGLVLHRPQPAASEDCARPDPVALRARAVDAVAGVLARHADRLRGTPEAAASALLAVTFGTTHSFFGGGDLADPDALADLLLHGISKDA